MSMWILLIILLVLALGGTSVANSFMTGLGGVSVNPTNETGVNVYSSNGTLTGSTITNDPSTWPGSDKIWNICEAIAFAEGYNLGVGTAPYDLNNPGDLGPGDENGEDTAGGPQWHGGSTIIQFAYAEGGWRALYAKFQHIIAGTSKVYLATDSWQVIASKYAGNSSAWVNNVTNYLGVDPTSTPKQYVG